MPRKPYWESKRFNSVNERRTLNRYRSACKRVDIRGRWFPVRHWEGGEWSPKIIEKTWFVISNPHMKPLIHNGGKP